MGYTHYFYRKPELDADRFNLAVNDASKLVAHLLAKEGYKIQRSYDLPEPAVFGIFGIELNGAGDAGYEDFRVPRVFAGPRRSSDEKGRVFGFCKTAHKPYNSAVIACLVVLAHHFGDDFGVSTDGNREADGPAADWRAVMAEAQAVLGYGNDHKFNDE